MLKKLSKGFLDGIACETYDVMLFFVFSLYSMLYFFFCTHVMTVDRPLMSEINSSTLKTVVDRELG